MSKQQLQLELNSNQTREALIQRLSELGYERVNMVIEPGTFAVKGSIVDVFAVNQNQPVRCDFFGGGIDRLSSFRIDTQRSIRDIESTKIDEVGISNIKSLNFDTRLLDSELISNIQDGDYVVHERYGIGIFKGFCRLTVAGNEGEYIFIQFKGTDKLYMPLEQIPLLHRYAGSDAKPKLNPLYDGSWEKTRLKAHRSLKLIAEEIYQMYKDRMKIKGFACLPDTEEQIALEADFPFQETPDQLKAIKDVKADMESPRPMDRLVCGDVGFGKTEVILRAAVKAALNMKQVMVLVPTTILAEQHFHTFHIRCKGLGVSVSAMSRMKTAKQNRDVLNRLKNHDLDIVIGTHRLLQKDIEFKDLGLVIIDEEQRFGVKHKEKIKHMASNIDILTTTATPIPRTLYMSLTGSKSMSVLATPPPGRMPIRTIVSEFSNHLITDAVNFEMNRGGQVFFLHNNIQQLETIRAQLKTWLPECRVRIAHGQMTGAQLDDVMVAFYRHEFDLLLSTTIIENGLDIQNANTIIINRADRMGLSQIHQIRGRVGRSSIQAYAYVLFPLEAQLTPDSKERLQALKEAVGLGVGYQLAMKDLEIRGAGTLLGEKQSGHLTAIGFDLYCKLLEKNLKQVRGINVSDETLMQLKDSPNVFIPSSYIPDPQERLAMYQRLLTVKSNIQLKRLVLECKDRYGELNQKMIDFIKIIEEQLVI